MSFFRQAVLEIAHRFRALFRRKASYERLEEEIRFHLEMREQRLREQGVSPEEARWQARRSFGNAPVIKETTREMWRYGSLETFVQDIRYAGRMLARTPAFAAVAVLSLALGIGANSAIFSLIDRVMLRMLPVRNPGDLVLFSGGHPYPRYEQFRDSGTTFDGVVGFASIARIKVDGSEDAGRLAEGRLVSGNYFGMLGVKPILGRVIALGDDRTPGAHPVVVISHAFWGRYFNSDPGVVGRTLRLSPGTLASGANTGGFEQGSSANKTVRDGGFTIIGVAPRGFFGETVGQYPDFWAPIMMQEHFMPGRPWLARKTASWVRVMARLKDGMSREQAQAAVNVLFQQVLIAEAGSTITDTQRRNLAQRRLEILDGDKGFSPLRGEFSKPLVVLMVMVGLVLLIACANLANLLLARASARRKEIGVRLALGASRVRIVRQLFTESLLLAFIGGAAGILVAWWGSQTMFAMVAEGNSSARLDLTPSPRMLLFTGAVALLTALLFGLIPAIRATRVNVNPVLKERGDAMGGGSQWKTGRFLVSAQVALSVLLLIGTGLFTRTLYNMKAQDLGYARENVLLMRVDPITAGHKDDAIGRVCKALLEKIRTLPGVRSATFSENGLFSGTESGARVRIEGFTLGSERDAVARFDQVGPGYFTGVGIPLLLGRDFSGTDNENAPRVAVINETMARFYFGSQNPVGRLLHYEGTDKFTLTIIGVARDARDHSMRAEVYRRFYVPFMQPVDGLTGANYEVRTGLEPAAMAEQLRTAVRQVNPNMPINSIKPLTTLIDESLLRERMIAKLSILFGILAIVLATVGLYGITAYSVVRRTGEIGIRMAVGARPRDVVWMVLRETVILVAVGVALGVPIALGLSRFIESLLYGLKPNDAFTIAGAVVLIGAIAVLAATGPARRAASVDPIVALRYE